MQATRYRFGEKGEQQSRKANLGLKSIMDAPNKANKETRKNEEKKKWAQESTRNHSKVVKLAMCRKQSEEKKKTLDLGQRRTESSPKGRAQ